MKELGLKNPKAFLVLSWSGGNPENVGLNVDARASLSQRIRDRYEIAKDLDNDPSKPRLNEYDRFLLQRGEGFVDKLAGGEALNEEELTLAYSVITDELIQKSTTTRQEIESGTGRFARMREVFGETRVVGGIVRRFSRAETVSITTSRSSTF